MDFEQALEFIRKIRNYRPNVGFYDPEPVDFIESETSIAMELGKILNKEHSKGMLKGAKILSDSLAELHPNHHPL